MGTLVCIPIVYFETGQRSSRIHNPHIHPTNFRVYSFPRVDDVRFGMGLILDWKIPTIELQEAAGLMNCSERRFARYLH